MKEYIPPNPSATHLPPHDSPFMEQIMQERNTPEKDRELLRQYAEEGWVVVDVGIDDFDALAARTIEELAPKYPKGDHRLGEAWYFNDTIRRLAAAPKIMEALRTLYWRAPIPFQTLNFKSGTHQPPHSDTIHFHCVPRHYMCGVWLALEDIGPECGPITVWPGSHRLPTYDMFDFGLPATPEHYQRYEDLMLILTRDDKPFQRKEVTMKCGQALIWHANLLHGGAEVRDPNSTRHSLVTHYYFDDCIYYFPMASEPYRRQMCVREVLNLDTGEIVPHKYRGKEISLAEYGEMMLYPRPLPDWVKYPEDYGANGQARDPAQQADAALSEQLTAMEANLQKLDGDNERLASLEKFLREDIRKLQTDTRELRTANDMKQERIQELEAELSRIQSSTAYKLANRISKPFAGGR